jgi:hypothetical protein
VRIRKHILICVFISFMLAGCGPANNSPTSEIDPSTEMQQPIQTSEITSTQNPGQADVASWSGNTDDLLRAAVQTLEQANSFHIEAHETRAYQAMPANGEAATIYGDFIMNYDVFRSPTLKIHTIQSYRYDPEAGYESDESFTVQLNDQYVYQTMENGQLLTAETIDFDQIEPLAGDVYQTLIHFSDQFVFVGEKDGQAIYVLDHPQWYVLKGALGFADLGMLKMLGMNDTEIKQYALENYPSAKPIRFTLYVSIKEQTITKVVVDDKDFMLSIWEDVDRALIERGEAPENLTDYTILEDNISEYLFRDYNQVQDFTIPS